MEPYKKTLERLGTLQLEGDVMEIIGKKKVMEAVDLKSAGCS